MNIGDTLTMQWRANVPECVDIPAAGPRWTVEPDGIVALDAVRGHVTALRPGEALFVLWGAGDALGEAGLGVLEPPGADSIVTSILNHSSDSARVVLEDASGTTRRAQTVAAGGSTCWVTPLSDSVQYSAVFYRPTPPPDSIAGYWISKGGFHGGLSVAHTWQVFLVDSSSYEHPFNVAPVNPDPGRGC